VWPLAQQSQIDGIITDALITAPGSPEVYIIAVYTRDSSVIIKFELSTHIGSSFALVCGTAEYKSVGDLKPNDMVMVWAEDPHAFSSVSPVDNLLLLSPQGVYRRANVLSPQDIVALSTPSLFSVSGWLLAVQGGSIVPGTESVANTWVCLGLNPGLLATYLSGIPGDLEVQVVPGVVMPGANALRSVSGLSSAITLSAGYNAKLERNSGVIRITASPGLGEQQGQIAIAPGNTLSGAIPDSYGNVNIRTGDHCFNLLSSVVSGALILELNSSCAACCSCADYVAVGKLIQARLKELLDPVDGFLYTDLGFPELDPDAEPYSGPKAGTLARKYNDLLDDYKDKIIPKYNAPVVRCYGAMAKNKATANMVITVINRGKTAFELTGIRIALDPGETSDTWFISGANYGITPDSNAATITPPDTQDTTLDLDLSVTIPRSKTLVVFVSLGIQSDDYPDTWSGSVTLLPSSPEYTTEFEL
jgi:hypothetical protein